MLLLLLRCFFFKANKLPYSCIIESVLINIGMENPSKKYNTAVRKYKKKWTALEIILEEKLKTRKQAKQKQNI